MTKKLPTAAQNHLSDALVNSIDFWCQYRTLIRNVLFAYGSGEIDKPTAYREIDLLRRRVKNLVLFADEVQGLIEEEEDSERDAR